MKKPSFLSRLKADGKLGLVEPSADIRNSYLGKADDCLKSARLLLQNDLYENSISMSYYTMYNSLLALLFETGIKSENHAGSILVFKFLFKRKDLFDIISKAKEERIDTQYYVATKSSAGLTKDSASDMLSNAENFSVQVRLIINNLKGEEIKSLRTDF